MMTYMLFVGVKCRFETFEVISRRCLLVAVVLLRRKAMPQTQAMTPHPVTVHRHTGHDTPPSHSIQTRGRPVVVLSIYVERHSGIHNYPFLVTLNE